MDYLEYMLNKHEQEEAEAEFYNEHGMTYDEYLKALLADYEDSKNER